jgi:hypothetical protein
MCDSLPSVTFPDEIRQAEIGLIDAIQHLPRQLEPVMEFLSFFGREDFFLLVLPAIYWCFSPRLGLKIAIVFLISAGTNTIFKLLCHAPRPYWLDSRIEMLSREKSFGMPSGHAQVAITVWGLLAAARRKPAAWVAALILTGAIGFSRIYLGVHFISDVVVGLMLGAAILLICLRFERTVMAWWLGWSVGAQVGWAAAFSAGLLGTGIGVVALHAGWTAPMAWIRTEGGNPESLKTLVAVSGALFGTLAGGSIMHQRGFFDAAGSALQRILRWVVGTVGIIVIMYGLDAFLPKGEGLVAMALSFLRYTLLMVWIFLAAPAVLERLRLISRKESSTRPRAETVGVFD